MGLLHLDGLSNILNTLNVLHKNIYKNITMMWTYKYFSFKDTSLTWLKEY